MKKCDFCTQSSPNGNGFWPSQVAREKDCEKAIQRMMKALEIERNKKKNL